MLPHTHFLLPFFLGLITVKMGYLALPFAFLAGLIGVFVDVDHYIEHIFYAKSHRFSLRATWNNSIRLHRFNQRSFIHYWPGAVVLTLFFASLAFFHWQISFVLLMGYYSHLWLDFSHLRAGTAWRLKLGHYYLKETSTELLLDSMLVLGILAVLFL